jgi:hypothetical protein
MRKTFGALLLAFTLAACNGDSTSPKTGTLAGNYLLRTANGTAVPGVASQDATGLYEVLHGRVLLQSDFSFLDSLQTRFTPTGGAAQAQVEVRIGNYVQTGNNITLYFQSGSTLNLYSMTWIDPNTLAYSERELSLIYSK